MLQKRSGYRSGRTFGGQRSQLRTSRSHNGPPLWRRYRVAILPIVVCLAGAALVVSIFFRTVDLKPKVDETFFFSKNDPQLRSDNRIVKTFPDTPQIILAATGDIQSPAYMERVQALSSALLN